ncbi:MAG: aspartate aminotransferase family protein [Gammaproteobacteria bacterium]|nr:aspartate aminotransferase family protein [Gammaproteobacteria bacterium]
MNTRLHNELDLNAYWMPFTANRAFKSEPRLIESASGMMCRTDDGREVLDAISGLWCCNAGHCHPHIAAAIAEQARTLDYTTAFQVGHPTVFRLAERIAGMAPDDLDAVFFTNSGSESVDTALKIALAYHQARGEASRTRLVGRERGYHGVGFGGLSVGGIGNNRKSFGPLLPGVLHLPTTYDHEHQAFSRGQPEWGAHLADELERIVAVNHPSTIAAVIVEPFAGSAGVLVPPVGYLERLREITAHYGILLIFDEVITAFGRLGASFAATRFDVVPDMITCAKGITSGTVPMGAVLARESIRAAIIDNAPDAIEFFHGYTYSGHPLASAAAMATLDVYEDEQLFERSRKLAPLFEDALHRLADKPHVKDIRNIGLAGAVEFEPRAGEPGARASAAFAAAYERGLLIRTTADVIALAPPLIATPEHIETITETLGDVLDGVK